MKYFTTCIILCIFLNLNASVHAVHTVPEKYHGVWMKAEEFNHEEHGLQYDRKLMVRFEKAEPILWVFSDMILWPKPGYPGGFIAMPITSVHYVDKGNFKLFIIEFKEYQGKARSFSIIETKQSNVWLSTMGERDHSTNTIAPIMTYTSTVVPVLLNRKSISRFKKNHE